ncbi:MAG: type II toxin-antitoxin system VapC family toxin [Betaproteobacteria bacterium]|nr:MAG: type II toxin-antitoxin system VapC family toxin [Betaproteobacteria bacterium]
MPAFVLDTNTVIDYFKGRGKVAERLLAVAPREIGLPAIAVYEVWVGVLGSQHARRRESQYEQFLAVIEVVPFDSAISRRAAELRLALERRGESIGPLDTLIAGTALACGATLVTRNTKEFGRVVGLKVANWHD